MEKSTKEKLIKAIEILTDKIKSDVKSDDALRYTQAALNLAHVYSTLIFMRGGGGD